MKHNESLHQNPYLSEPPSGTADRTSSNIFNNKLPADISKKIQSKKESKENNGNVISSDSKKNTNNVVYILSDSMIKHVNGRHVSDHANVKVSSHPGATTKDLIDYVKPIALKKPKMLVIHTGRNDLPNDMNTIKKLKTVVQSIREIDVNQEIKIAFSGIINREDHNFEKEKKRSRNVTPNYKVIANQIDCIQTGKVLFYYAKTLLNVLRLFDYLMRKWFIEMIFRVSLDKLKELRVNNRKDNLFAYLNIDSIRNKFGNLCSLSADKVDILTIAESKLDGSFPTYQFLIKGFHQPFRLDISRNSDGLLIYIKSSLPAKFLSNYTFPSNIQAIPFFSGNHKPHVSKTLRLAIMKRSS